MTAAQVVDFLPAAFTLYAVGQGLLVGLNFALLTAIMVGTGKR